jgi:transcription initiation factor IIE alpha subunit
VLKLTPFPEVLILIQILQCLKKYGQRLDSEIAKEMGIPVAAVRRGAASLMATGAVISCSVTRYENSKRIDGLVYRVSGYTPPAAPGRKSSAAVAAATKRKPIQR